MAYNMYVFNREGVCLHYAEWRRPKPVAEGAGTMEDDAKMMFGLTFSLKNLCTALDPKGCASPPARLPVRPPHFPPRPPHHPTPPHPSLRGLC